MGHCKPDEYYCSSRYRDFNEGMGKPACGLPWYGGHGLRLSFVSSPGITACWRFSGQTSMPLHMAGEPALKARRQPGGRVSVLTCQVRNLSLHLLAGSNTPSSIAFFGQESWWMGVMGKGGNTCKHKVVCGHLCSPGICGGRCPNLLMHPTSYPCPGSPFSAYCCTLPPAQNLPLLHTESLIFCTIPEARAPHNLPALGSQKN